MFFLNSDVYYIIFSFSWQINILYYGLICRNNKGVIIGLIPINGFIAILAWNFLNGSSPIDLGELYLILFIVESLCLIIFRVGINKYLPNTPIIQTMSKKERRDVFRIIRAFAVFCFIILVFELFSYEKTSHIMQSYVCFNLLLIINIIINSIIAKKIRSISQNID